MIPRSRRACCGSFRTRTGKGPSSRRAKSTSTWDCRTFWKRCGSSRPSRATVSCSTRSPTCGPFWSAYPEEAAAFRKFVAEGRLQLVLGMDVMPDVNMPGGETFIRQILYGKGYYRDQLGVDVTNCWLVDTFRASCPTTTVAAAGRLQIVLVLRGVPSRQHPSEFLWQGIDGTQIPAFWLPHSYGLMYNSPKDLPHFEQFVKARYELLGRNSQETDRVACSGVDVSMPEEHLAPMIEAYDRKPNQPLRLKLAVPADFEAVVAKRKNLQIFRGELNPIFQGTYSSRIEIKHEMRDMERLLTTAETLGVLAERLGGGIPDRMCWPAWEPVLFNETHDLASGVMTDHVYEDTLAGYAFSRRLANQWIETLREQIAAKIDTRGNNIRATASRLLSSTHWAGLAPMWPKRPWGSPNPASTAFACKMPTARTFRSNSPRQRAAKTAGSKPRV